MDDEPLVATGRMLYSIGKGAVSGLQEALSIEDLNETAVAFMSSFGISIAAGALIDAPMVIAVLGILASVIAVISSSFMAAQAVEGIYSTATGAGTSYQKAENYAHDAVLLILSVGAIAGSAVELAKNVENLQSVLNTLEGRKDRFRREEILDNTDDNVALKEIECIFGYNDFMNCAAGYMDMDALRYLQDNLADNEDISFLRKTAKIFWKGSRGTGNAQLNKTDVAFGLDKLLESGSVDDAVQTIIRCNKTNLHRYGNFYDILKQQGVTLEEFDALKLRDAATLNKHERRVLKAVRESIANPTEDTLLRKTIPISAVDDYLKEGGRNTIQGYVARDCDVAHIKSYSYLRESLCLNYVSNGKEPFPADGNEYGYIKFRTGDTGNLKITYGKEFGGTNQDGYPCTRNGFLGSENGEIIPEWKLKNIKEDGENAKAMKPEEGAEIHKVINGKDYLVGTFDGESFVSCSNAEK